MTLHGKQLIGATKSAASSNTFNAYNATTNQPIDPPFHEATDAEIDAALNAAADAFDTLRATTPEQRAKLLETIADNIEALGDPLLERANIETALPNGRLTAERGRTVGQTRLFANFIREGSWVDAKIDLPNPERQPMPKPDVRTMLIPMGPIVVFGASNFPFAISVAGTDTISALAVGCPVVVKAHPAHPGTCEMIGQAIIDALKSNNLPEGCFSMVQGASHEVGLALVKHPKATAVAFTGSLQGGRALFDAAAARPNPIPVYAELGSINPVFLLPGALRERSDQIAAGFIGSVNMGVGQFCTNPGLVLGLKGETFDNFITHTAEHAAKSAPATMLHPGIAKAYNKGIKRIADTHGVTQVGKGEAKTDPNTQAATAVFSTDIQTVTANPHLLDENFGPSSIVVQCDKPDQLLEAARNLEGHLTATIHGTEQDLKEHAELVAVLQTKVGRLVFNGFPTGIEVCHAMNHGGPYPASTDAHFTSIGTASLLRFVRPLCYQGFPDGALPAELQNGNPRGVWRLVEGERTKDACG